MRDEFDDTPEQLEALQSHAAMRTKPDGDVDPAGEAGWYLERERLRRGETLDMAGEATGIHPYHIEAIEYGDMTRMPERLDALQMIGIYAQYLGFDAEPLVNHYAHFLPRPPLAPKARHPANPAPLSSAKVLKFGKMPKLPKFSFSVSGIPGGTGGLVASVAGAIFLFAGASWMMLPDAPPPQPANDQVAVAVDTMPTASTGAESADVQVTETALPDDTPATSQQAAADETAGTNLDGLTALIEQNALDPAAAKDKKKAATAAAPVPQPINPDAATQVASADDVQLTPDGREFGAKTGGSRLVLKAKAPVWVRIEDAQGNVVMTQMLMKGDSYRVPDRNGLVVIARDGGLLSYIIDGQEKGVLGTPGEILVGRSLDIKALEGQG